MLKWTVTFINPVPIGIYMILNIRDVASGFRILKILGIGNFAFFEGGLVFFFSFACQDFLDEVGPPLSKTMLRTEHEFELLWNCYAAGLYPNLSPAHI